jgi:hypothetical protein
MNAVDIALCLAMDVSASVDYAEFGLMAGGTAAALREPDIQAACTAGPRGAVAVALLLWSGPGARDLAVPWTRVDGPAAALALAEAIENAPRLPAPGGTALGEGMAAALAVLGACPAQATRLVIDVAGDGQSNQGRPPGPVRDLAVAAGVTVNGLAILDEEPDLLAHYREEVIGGPGSFAMHCPDYVAFAEAIRAKLRRELGGALLS